jgi:hypothetical protein
LIKEIIAAFVKEVGLTPTGASNYYQSLKNLLKSQQTNNQIRWWDIETEKPGQAWLPGFQTDLKDQLPNHD